MQIHRLIIAHMDKTRNSHWRSILIKFSRTAEIFDIDDWTFWLSGKWVNDGRSTRRIEQTLSKFEKSVISEDIELPFGVISGVVEDVAWSGEKESAGEIESDSAQELHKRLDKWEGHAILRTVSLGWFSQISWSKSCKGLGSSFQQLILQSSKGRILLSISCGNMDLGFDNSKAIDLSKSEVTVGPKLPIVVASRLLRGCECSVVVGHWSFEILLGRNSCIPWANLHIIVSCSHCGWNWHTCT